MHTLSLILLLAITVTSSSAQTGSLSGKVTTGNKPLPYATVTLAGTRNGATANQLGIYEIKNIAPGEYTVTFSSVGYYTESV